MLGGFEGRMGGEGKEERGRRREVEGWRDVGGDGWSGASGSEKEREGEAK